MPQFRKGQSGNPAGRPPGSRNRATSMVQNLLEGAAENIAKRAAQLAEEGNVAAIRICMNRLSPLGQHNPVAYELPPIHSTQAAKARRTLTTASFTFRGGGEPRLLLRLLCACSGGGGIRFFSTRSKR